MLEPLLELPSHVRSRLAKALASGMLQSPYRAASVRSTVGGEGVAEIQSALEALEERGMPGPAVAMALQAVEETLARVPAPDLVWSGPEVPGLHARDTRRVHGELIAAAEESLWMSSYTFFDGQSAFRSVAERMEAVPALEVRLLLNIQRRHGDGRKSSELVRAYAERFWGKEWPGERAPMVFYDPRSLEDDGPAGVLHAKAVVADREVALVTSANLTEAAFDRNIEMGLLVRDRPLAESISTHFASLIERGLLYALPQE